MLFIGLRTENGEFRFGWVKFEIPVSKWTDEFGNPGRVQGSDLSQIRMVFEATGLDDVTYGREEAG